MKKEKRFKYNIKAKWLWIITIFAFSALSLAAGFFVPQIINKGQERENIKEGIIAEIEKKECPDCVRRMIDGVYGESEKSNVFPVGIVIENQSDARPQSGLAAANLVYEAEAEGYITRFLAFYADGAEIDKIGPVRSARPYFVDWVNEFSALFAHCGGSPEALAKIKKDKIFDLNEFYNEKYFWRDNAREAPHNIYTSSGKMRKYLETAQTTEGKYLPWLFKDDAEASSRPENSEIIINFQLADFVVKWKYNKENNDYARYMAGDVHKDKEGGEIRAKNVIIQYVKAKIIDDALRLKMEHVGQGKAIVCLDGKCEEGEWRKNSVAARTRFYSKNNEEFKFNAGATWIEVVRPEIEINY